MSAIYGNDLLGKLRVHYRGRYVAHMINVTQKTILARHIIAVARRALRLFDRFEIRHKYFWIMTFVSVFMPLRIIDVMTGQAALFAKKAKVGFVSE